MLFTVFSWINYELQPLQRIEAFKGIMAHFKTKEKQITWVLLQQAMQTLKYTHIKLYIWPMFVNTVYLLHSYKALHQCYIIRISVCRTKSINCSPCVLSQQSPWHWSTWLPPISAAHVQNPQHKARKHPALGATTSTVQSYLVRPLQDFLQCPLSTEHRQTPYTYLLLQHSIIRYILQI